MNDKISEDSSERFVRWVSDYGIFMVDHRASEEAWTAQDNFYLPKLKARDDVITELKALLEYGNKCSEALESKLLEEKRLIEELENKIEKLKNERKYR